MQGQDASAGAGSTTATITMDEGSKTATAQAATAATEKLDTKGKGKPKGGKAIDEEKPVTAASAKTQIINVKPVDLTELPELQARVDKLNMDHVQDLVDALGKGQVLPAVEVVDDGGRYLVWDGHHTAEAYRVSAAKTIPVSVRKGTLEDAIALAAGTNYKHGLKRTSADKRRAVDMLLSIPTWRDRSDNWIAETTRTSWHIVKEARAAYDLAHPPAPKPEPTPAAAAGAGESGKPNTETVPVKEAMGTKRVSKSGKKQAATKKGSEADKAAEKRRNDKSNAWDGYNDKLDEAMSILKGARTKLMTAFRIEGKDSKDIQSPYAISGNLSYSGTIAPLNELIRLLEASIIVGRRDDAKPGAKNEWLTDAGNKAAESAKKSTAAKKK